MTIYAVHWLSGSADTVTPMEEFPNLERASVAFQLRARKQRSGAYFMSEPRPLPLPRPEVDFPGADATGHMVVWVRSHRHMPPRPDETPDEHWWLSDAGVVRREPWDPVAHSGIPIPVSAVSPEMDPAHPDLAEAEAEFIAEDHPGFGAVAISYWQGGRMELKDVQSGTCDCGKDELHERAARIQATLLTGQAYNLPPDTMVWHVRSGAPDALSAQKMARTVAKGLGFDRNPISVLETS